MTTFHPSAVLGPADEIQTPGVSIDRDGHVLTVRAARDLAGLATGRFATPSCGLAFARERWPADIEFVGFAFTQFALPVTAGADLAFDFRPAPGLRSPRAVSPLLARSGNTVVLLAPIDHAHEQVIAVTDAGLAWGWHGDLDEVPNGFACRLGVYEGSSVAEVLARWRDDLDLPDPSERLADDPLSTHLSYWTDNGAAYWYRTESGRTISESVADKVDELRAHDVPIRSIELDSWFYSHATPRAITEVGYPDEVPPTGMWAWLPRSDAYPRRLVDGIAMQATGEPDGVEAFADRLGRPPLVLHARHIAPTSPYVSGSDDWWIDEHAVHPKDPEFFRRWFDDARRWGATVIEQDWMLIYWFGVRALRSVPGRALAWQQAMNEHARATGLGLLWCMATPADMIEAARLDRVVALRTSDDYRFNDDPAFLWTWFLTVNRLAATLDLPAFKDCFFSSPDVSDESDAIDGDLHAELEAALAALSNGPVGVGDRIGRTNRTVVMRTCDSDGRLRRLDGPIAAVDECLFGGPARGEGLMWATTTATDRHGVWRYVLAINTSDTDQTDSFDLSVRSTVYDWRSATSVDTVTITTSLSPRDWSLMVVSPTGAPSAGEIGDATRYVVVEATR
ncbi:MAG: hypothetical protein AB8G26_18505 [Ilumatobacter sp.]